MLRTSNEELSQFESTNPKFKLDSLKKEHILTSTKPQPQEGPIPPQAPLPQHVPTICCSMKISVAFLSFIARPKSPMRKWSSESRKRFLRLKICEGRRLHIHQDIFGMKRGWRFKKMWMARGVLICFDVLGAGHSYRNGAHRSGFHIRGCSAGSVGPVLVASSGCLGPTGPSMEDDPPSHVEPNPECGL